jgi:hypothetical protein
MYELMAMIEGDAFIHVDYGLASPLSVSHSGKLS